MKSSLSWFQHSTGAHNDPRLKALKARAGWEGVGRYWALVEMIGAAEGAVLDLTPKYARPVIAEELGLTPEALESFLVALRDDLELLHYEDGRAWADETTDDLSRVMPEREAARRRREKRAARAPGDSKASVGDASGDARANDGRRGQEIHTLHNRDRDRRGPLDDRPDATTPEELAADLAAAATVAMSPEAVAAGLAEWRQSLGRGADATGPPLVRGELVDGIFPPKRRRRGGEVEGAEVEVIGEDRES